MSKRGYVSIIVCSICLFLLPLSVITICIAQDVTNDEKIIQRYKQLLYQKPKEGSTFDRVYQFYLEGSGLEAMLNDYQAEVQANSNDPNLHLILGHLYKRLGKNIDAVKAYQRAVENSNLKTTIHISHWVSSMPHFKTVKQLSQL